VFNILNIGKSAVLLAQKNLEVVGHNMANVNNPEYSRQRVIQTSASPIEDAFGSYGTGAEIVRLERMRDAHLDSQYRDENSKLNYWQKLADHYEELESLIGEPSDYGLSANLNDFWDKWEELANNPNSNISRVDLRESAQRLTNSFHNLDARLEEKKKTLSLELEGMTETINGIASEMSELLARIHLAEAENKSPNDLLDKLDSMADGLSKYGDVRVVTREDGFRIVYFGADEIADQNGTRELKVAYKTTLEKQDAHVVWKDNLETVNALNNGEINAIIHMRDDILSTYQDKLDRLAVEITNNVNEIHKRGYSIGENPSHGIEFFKEDIKGATDFNLSDSILYSTDKICASLQGEEGDNRIALQISMLREDLTIDGTYSFGNYFSSILTDMGNESYQAKNNAEMYQATTDQVYAFRENVKGVSIDEEAADMLKYQHSFMAAAKIVTMAESMFSTILGIVK